MIKSHGMQVEILFESGAKKTLNNVAAICYGISYPSELSNKRIVTFQSNANNTRFSYVLDIIKEFYVNG